jgi:hypothetical protein
MTFEILCPPWGQVVIVKVIAMTERGFVIVLNLGIFVLLLILVMEAAGMRRSLRRIEREERALVHGQANHFQVLNGWTAKFLTDESPSAISFLTALPF